MILITGMYRSGTSLVWAIFDQSDNAQILFQPLGQFLVDTKQAFLKQNDIEDYHYPLDHLFQKTGYRHNDFYRYLQAENFHDALKAQLALSRQKTLDKSCPLIGFKDVLAEEYIPYLLDQGVQIVHIIRDIRDVLTSTNYGRGAHYKGKIHPTLHNIRNWRKSVAYGLRFRDHPGYCFLRYEDLVQQPDRTIAALYDQFGLQGHDIAQKVQGGNSSHGSKEAIDPLSVGKFHQLLDKEVAAYCLRLCAPELLTLGYCSPDAFKAAMKSFHQIATFKEPYPMLRPEIPAGYSEDPKELAHETTRYNLLQVENSLSPDEIEAYFLWEESYTRLRASFPGSGLISK